jgi:hypothetical protein
MFGFERRASKISQFLFLSINASINKIVNRGLALHNFLRLKTPDPDPELKHARNL